MTLCRFHHRLVHEGRAGIQTLDDGAFRFVKANGQAFESPAPQPTGWQELIAGNDAVAITPSTAITRWTGESLNLGLAVQGLMQRRKKNVSAETLDGKKPAPKSSAP